jgi:hypothetical protein
VCNLGCLFNIRFTVWRNVWVVFGTLFLELSPFLTHVVLSMIYPCRFCPCFYNGITATRLPYQRVRRFMYFNCRYFYNCKNDCVLLWQRNLHLVKAVQGKFFFVFVLGPVCKILKATTTSFVLSVRLRGTTLLPVGGFSLNLKFENFSKICWENSSLIKIWQE